MRWVLSVIPMTRPEIVTTAAGPAVFHADFSPVDETRPAKPGEILIAKATGMGPTRPGIDPGQPFPLVASPVVNSPVEITANGQAAEVVNQIGWPGQLDTYRVDFRLPADTAKGVVRIQIVAAWIPGAPVSIAVQ